MTLIVGVAKYVKEHMQFVILLAKPITISNFINKKKHLKLHNLVSARC